MKVCESEALKFIYKNVPGTGKRVVTLIMTVGIGFTAKITTLQSRRKQTGDGGSAKTNEVRAFTKINLFSWYSFFKFLYKESWFDSKS